MTDWSGRSSPTPTTQISTGNERIARGEIWLAALDPTIGSEIQKTRPCVIISPPEMHDFLRTVTVAPMTTGSRPAPYRIPLRFRRKDALILLDQMRTLDKQRLVRRLGSVTAPTLSRTLTVLREMFQE
jgi:mRNA interferase MazF